MRTPSAVYVYSKYEGRQCAFMAGNGTIFAILYGYLHIHVFEHEY